MANRKPESFRSWLQKQLDEQQIPRRELARRLAEQHPKGITVETTETYRRAIYRYLDADAPMIPNQQTRAAFAQALGVDESSVPSEDDDEDELAGMLASIVRENRRHERSVKRLLEMGRS